MIKKLFNRIMKKWPCFLGRCRNLECRIGRKIEVEDKANRPPVKLQEYIFTCSRCKGESRKYKVMN